MSHVPVDHQLRSLYRVVAALTGGVVATFGIVGLVETRGADWFAQGDWSALGVATNRALAAAGLAFGVLVFLASLVGRNVDRVVSLYGAVCLLFVGTVMLLVAESSELIVVNGTAGTAAAAYVVGFVLLACGLYTQTSRRRPVPHAPAPAEAAATAHGASPFSPDSSTRASAGSSTGPSGDEDAFAGSGVHER